MELNGKGKPMDLIERQAAINTLETVGYDFSNSGLSEIELEEVCEAVGDVRQDMISMIKRLPPAQPETCEGCKHLGKWENEVEYGYPSPCTRCKRRVQDHYER